MKFLPSILLIITLLIASCASDSDSSTQSGSSDNASSNSTAPSSNNSAPVQTEDPNSNNQAPNATGNPALVSPTLPNNIRQLQQQNAQQQQFNIQQQQMQQQQQQQQVAQPVKSIGDEKTAHFICPNACKGSGADEAANCPVCSTPYTHNAESPWHEANNQTPPATTPQTNPAQPAIQQPVINPNTNPLPSGDNNTSHYICPDKCIGSGSLSPGKCPICAKDYVHNAESAAHKEEVRRREEQQNP